MIILFSEFKTVTLSLINNIIIAPSLDLKISAIDILFQYLNEHKQLWIDTKLAKTIKAKITEFSRTIPDIVKYNNLFFSENSTGMDIDE